MRDQAEQLRQIVKDLRFQRTKREKKPLRVVTITSGKGGVGKTSFTINFAICLGGMGFRVVIIDADFGLANVDLMLGITPPYDLSHFVSQHREFNEVAAEGPNGIRFVSGGSGLRELVDLNEWQLEQLTSKIGELDEIADIILIDTGAGISDSVVRMIKAADETILITTPEPTSITDAYALAKIVTSENPDIHMKLVVNKADSVFEAKEILDKFCRVAKRFLGVDLDKLGYLCNDPHVTRSVKQQQPYVIHYPKSGVSKQIRAIVEAFIERDESYNRETSGMASYVRRLIKVFK